MCRCWKICQCPPKTPKCIGKIICPSTDWKCQWSTGNTHSFFFREGNKERWKRLIRFYNNNDNSFGKLINWESQSNCFTSCGLTPSLMRRAVKLTNSKLWNMDFLCVFVLIPIIRVLPRETVKMAPVIKRQHVTETPACENDFFSWEVRCYNFHKVLFGSPWRRTILIGWEIIIIIIY